MTDYSDVKDKRNKSKHGDSHSIGSNLPQTQMQTNSQNTESSMNLVNKTFNEIIDSIQHS